MVAIGIRRSSKRTNDRQEEQEYRRNAGIRGYRACLLVDEDGTRLGMFDVNDARRLASERGLDLVEISPNSNPPVCRLMNYSKFLYERQKKRKNSRKKSQELKQMKFRCKIGDGDYDTKKGHVRRFLEHGDKVKVTIMFRGREMSYPERGMQILDRLAEELSDVSTVVQKPLMEGRDMTMVLSPAKRPQREAGEES